MSDEVQEVLIDFATALEAACVQLKRHIGEIHGVDIEEKAFTVLVGWTKTEGTRLGEFEYTTEQANNKSDAFKHAFNILKVNNASIKDHFGEKGWKYRYWIWPQRHDTIYRKERKKQG